MDIRIRQANRVTVVYPVGDLDVGSAKIIELIGQLMREGRTDILINLQNVESVDNNGLTILMIVFKYASSEDATVKLCSVPQSVRNILNAAHLDSVFEIYGDEEYAINSFDTVTKIDRLHLRRRFKRMDLGVEAEFKLSVTSTPTVFRGKVVNISGDGLFIYSKKTFPVGSNLDITLRLRGEAKPLKLSGVVIWLADKELQPHVYPGMGVEFIDLSSPLQQKVIDYIEKNINHRTWESTI